jgi:hypothetical protein
MEHVMNEYSSNQKIKALKLVSVLLMATFLQVGTAHSEGGLGGALGGALGGLGGALGGGGSSGGSNTGGALGGLGNAVGGITGGVNKTLNGVTSNIANTTTKLGILDPKGALSFDGKSDLTNSLMAKARVLSPKELAKLCLSAGGGNKGCGSGNKPQILGLIDVKLDLLNKKQLLGLCVGAGAGCGGTSITIGGGGGDGGGGGNGGGDGGGLGGMSRGEVIAYKKRCVNVLSSPQRYESDIVSLCRLIKRQRV